MRLASIWTDNAIIQRDKPIVLWGWCDAPRVRVDATLGPVHATGAAGWDGRFEVRLPALPTGGPYELHVKATGGEECVLKNLLIGEVWLISGQSNAEYPLKTFTPNDPRAQTGLYLQEGGVDDKLRMFTVPRDSLTTTCSTVAPGTCWKSSDAKNAPDFSAVGAWFALYLRKRLPAIPVGVIHCSWGATNIWPWLSREALAAIPSGRPLLEEYDRLMNQPETWASYPPPYSYTEQPPALLEQARATGKYSFRGYPAYDWDLPHKLFDTMLAPLIPYGLRGILWYQGEEDADFEKDFQPYHERLLALIKDWRYRWADPELPFLCVQLESWCAPSTEGWAGIQDTQRRLCLEMPNAGTVATNDLSHDEPDNNHQHDKRPIGYRLAQLALGRTYGFNDVTPAGPTLTKITAEGSSLRLHFLYAKGLHTSDGKPIRAFEIAGEDGSYHPADAQIDGEEILLSAPEVPAPKTARYNWRPRLPEGNLVNGAEQPALVFRQESSL